MCSYGHVSIRQRLFEKEVVSPSEVDGDRGVGVGSSEFFGLGEGVSQIDERIEEGAISQLVGSAILNH